MLSYFEAMLAYTGAPSLRLYNRAAGLWLCVARNRKLCHLPEVKTPV